MKKRIGDSWIPTEKYAHGLTGLSINILVSDVESHVEFVRSVLGLRVVYSDPDIAVYRWEANEWMVHADHTYDDSDNPMREVVRSMTKRGGGVELRVHGCDPDAAEAAAKEHGFEVLAPSQNKPHGLRESYIRDPDGYVWVPDVPVPTTGVTDDA